MKELVIKKLYKTFAELSAEAIEAMADIAIADMEKQQTVTVAPAAPAATTVYVDGSFITTTEVVGWGYLILNDGKEVAKNSGASNNAGLAGIRNVAGELMATMRGISHAVKLGSKDIVVMYDYEGIGAWADGKWRCKNEYTKKYAQYIASMRKEVTIEFQWTRGHSGNRFNEQVDNLARNAARNFSC